MPKPCFLRLFCKHPGPIRPSGCLDPASSSSRVVTLMTGCLPLSPMRAAMPTQQDDQQVPKCIFPRARSLHVRDDLRDSTPRQLMPRHLRSAHTARHSRYGRIYVGRRFARDKCCRGSYGISAEMLVLPCPPHSQSWAGVQIASCEQKHTLARGSDHNSLHCRHLT
jgi:hypothetical protein